MPDNVEDLLAEKWTDFEANNFLYSYKYFGINFFKCVLMLTTHGYTHLRYVRTLDTCIECKQKEDKQVCIVCADVVRICSTSADLTPGTCAEQAAYGKERLHDKLKERLGSRLRK